MDRRAGAGLVGVIALVVCAARLSSQQPVIGSERAVPEHLSNGAELNLTIAELIEHGRKLFTANWTDEDGAGRPLSTGRGHRLTDPARQLRGPYRFNRVSGPDANSCSGCHNAPHGIAGGGGDVVSAVFVQADRFDHVTFDRADVVPLRGSIDEAKRPVTLQTAGNLRATTGLFGAGYVEMLARQMSTELQAIRDSILPGKSKPLTSKDVSFGSLTRRIDGSWDTSKVEGLPSQSTRVAAGAPKPSLVIQPWHQSGSSPSLRDFVNTAFNRHHGIQTSERFGVGTDPDGDGVINEMTRGDVTAVTAFLATLQVPGRVVPNDPAIERAIVAGERAFGRIGCTTCHVPALPLDRNGWIYSEPGPFNPTGNLRRATGRILSIDLTNPSLPPPRLRVAPEDREVVWVPAFTDLKLHDITDPLDSEASEPLDINQATGSAKFLAGNRRFLTKRLWGAGNEPPYFHDGLLTTLREAILAHAGEALRQRQAFEALPKFEQDGIVEFLRSLQVLPPGTTALVVDEQFRPKKWPPITETNAREP